ncbi:MAG: DUF2975 domain-containing protein [Caulobacter sp.]|nr:DUF2975 domain-containing protein [Caulobacter sp.]
MTDDREPLARQARGVEVGATLAAVLMVLALLQEAGVVPLVFGLMRAGADGAAPALEVLHRFLLQLIPMLPSFIYLGGLLAARSLFGRVARGELFSPANSRAIAKIGSALWGGALAAMVVAPVLLSIVDHDQHFHLRAETGTLVLAVIGGAITVLGGMMARAQDENAALRSELSDFV